MRRMAGPLGGREEVRTIGDEEEKGKYEKGRNRRERVNGDT